MYTDLLLGLMIVFMATVSFIPEAAPTKKPSAYVYSQRFEQVFERVYVIKDLTAGILDQDVSTFLIINNLPKQSVIVQAQFVGGFNANNESSTEAINRAVDLSAALNKSDPVLLSKAASLVDSSSQVKPSEIIIRLRFAALVR